MQCFWKCCDWRRTTASTRTPNRANARSGAREAGRYASHGYIETMRVNLKYVVVTILTVILCSCSAAKSRNAMTIDCGTITPEHEDYFIVNHVFNKMNVMIHRYETCIQEYLDPGKNLSVECRYSYQLFEAYGNITEAYFKEKFTTINTGFIDRYEEAILRYNSFWKKYVTYFYDNYQTDLTREIFGPADSSCCDNFIQELKDIKADLEQLRIDFNNISTYKFSKSGLKCTNGSKVETGRTMGFLLSEL